MPALPPINVTPSPLPNPMTVLNIARQRVNDLIDTPAGAPAPPNDNTLSLTQVGGANLLDVSTPQASQRTQIVFQSAYAQFQEYVEDLGSRVFIADDVVLFQLPANTNPDPSAQSWISWTEFFDGSNYWPGPLLPPDFMAPLRVTERITGTNSPFFPMANPPDGLRNQFVRGIYNRQWEWRSNRLHLVGAVGNTDLKLRYIRGLPPIGMIGQTPWYYVPLPVPGCQNALAHYVVAEVSGARGPDFVAQEIAMAESSADKLFNRQARADQRQNVRRRPRGTGSRGAGDGAYRYGL